MIRPREERASRATAVQVAGTVPQARKAGVEVGPGAVVPQARRAGAEVGPGATVRGHAPLAMTVPMEGKAAAVRKTERIRVAADLLH